MKDNDFIKKVSLLGEEWKPVPDFENLYVVSSYGRIISLSHVVTYNRYKQNIQVLIEAKLLKPQPSGCNNSYLMVGLFKNKKRYPKSIHRLVAEVFIPNPNNYPNINHKDCNGWNNTKENLEWCTQKYNANYTPTKEKMSKSAAVNRGISLIQIDSENNFLYKFDSIRETSRQLHISRHEIEKILSGVSTISVGYRLLKI